MIVRIRIDVTDVERQRIRALLTGRRGHATRREVDMWVQALIAQALQSAPDDGQVSMPDVPTGERVPSSATLLRPHYDRATSEMVLAAVEDREVRREIRMHVSSEVTAAAKARRAEVMEYLDDEYQRARVDLNAWIAEDEETDEELEAEEAAMAVEDGEWEEEEEGEGWDAGVNPGADGLGGAGVDPDDLPF